MALQSTRLIQLMMFGLVGLTLLVYLSYSLMSVSNGVDVTTRALLHSHTYPIKVRHTNEDVNTSVSSDVDIMVSKAAILVPNVFNKTLNNTDQKSPNIKSTSKANLLTNISLIADSSAIMARSIYQKGHSLPNAHLCPDMGHKVKLLILIMSAPSNKDARVAIRQTWGHYGTRRDVSLGFVLGTTSNKDLEESISAESYIYGDLIRGHFIDSYNNLTLKTISMLEWTDTYCPKVNFVLKTDDDMFINVSKLLSFIDSHLKYTRTIFGRLAKKWKPIRNKKSKYYVAPQQYMPAVFPDFTTGPAYLITSDLIHELFTKALDQTYLKLEDVFVTGIVGHALGIKLIHIKEFLNKRVSFNPCNIQKAISIHMIKTSEQFDLWKKLLDGRSKCK